MPSEATELEIQAKIRAETSENQLVKVVVVKVDAPQARIQSTLPTTATLTWSTPTPYGTSTNNVSSTLTYDVGTANVILYIFPWKHFEEISSDYMFYLDFQETEVNITGKGTITVGMPAFRSKPGFTQEARFSAFLTEIGNPNTYIAQSHSSVGVGTNFLPLIHQNPAEL